MRNVIVHLLVVMYAVFLAVAICIVGGMWVFNPAAASRIHPLIYIVGGFLVCDIIASRKDVTMSVLWLLLAFKRRFGRKS